MFLTQRGEPWYKDTTANPLSREFAKLLADIDDKAAKKRRKNPPAKLCQRGRSFYGLRHTYRTAADETLDAATIDLTMGQSARLDQVEHGGQYAVTKPTFKVAEIAEELRIKQDAVLRLIHSGEVRAVNVAAKGAKRPRWRITAEAFEAFLARRAAPVPTPRPPRRKAQPKVRRFFV